jgi:hypothetical protein
MAPFYFKSARKTTGEKMKFLKTCDIVNSIGERTHLPEFLG